MLNISPGSNLVGFDIKIDGSQQSWSWRLMSNLSEEVDCSLYDPALDQPQ